MKRSTNLPRLLSGLLLVSLLMTLLAGCQSPTVAPTADTRPLRLALLPILDALPIYVAQEAGLFERQGIKVEFIPVGSAAERDQVIAAGQADGMVNDMLAVSLFNRQTVQLQVVRYATVATKDAPLYRVLASPQSGIKTAKELAGVPIGVSQGSVIEYMTYKLLTSEGLKAEEIQTVAVPKIPDRLALLTSGQIKAATLPEPFSTLAMKQGAVLVVDDSRYADLGNSVISFRKAVLDERPQAVKAFMAALELGVKEVNANPAAWRKILGQYKLVPAGMETDYPMPKFPAASLPTQAQFDDVVTWAISRKLLEQKVSYASSVTSAFLAGTQP